MVQGRWYPMGSDLSVPMMIREAVFHRGEDALDAAAQQVVVYKEEVPVGAARLWWQDGAFCMGEVGVLEQERGKGFGDLLVRLCLFKSLTHSAALIRLYTPKETEGFFAKYGLVPVGEKDGLVTMEIRGENVQLSHCGGHCESCATPSPECVPKALR